MPPKKSPKQNAKEMSKIEKMWRLTSKIERAPMISLRFFERMKLHERNAYWRLPVRMIGRLRWATGLYQWKLLGSRDQMLGGRKGSSEQKLP
jgi:hypothetical protein